MITIKAWTRNVHAQQLQLAYRLCSNSSRKSYVWQLSRPIGNIFVEFDNNDTEINQTTGEQSRFSSVEYAP